MPWLMNDRSRRSAAVGRGDEVSIHFESEKNLLLNTGTRRKNPTKVNKEIDRSSEPNTRERDVVENQNLGHEPVSALAPLF